MSSNERRSRLERTVLIVDDEDDIRELLELTCLRMGLAAVTAASLAEARTHLAARSLSLCLTDMRLPDGDGLALVREIAASHPDLPVAVITAYGSMENAVQALKAGAFDYLSKPVALEQLRALVKSVFELPSATGSVSRPLAASSLTGQSPSMEQVRAMIERLARSQAPVYISGESGSGKERAARLIHDLGARASKPFVAVNCGAIPENLMESEFFGYRKGAFTGADSDRDGFFQVANGGTLFLDEVGDLPLSMQVKLLRAIQEKRVRRVGDTAELPVDLRVISATHRGLKELVEQGKFRQDLFYRLNVIELRMPALRERREDIPELVETLLARLTGEATAVPALTAEALQALMAYAFPGNVRELENILERALALHAGTAITLADLHLEPQEGEHGDEGGSALGGVALERESLQGYLDRVERHAILEALQKTDGNRTAASRLLGVTFRSLRYRMERLGMKD